MKLPGKALERNMISKTKIKQRKAKKTDPNVVATLEAAKNKDPWRKIAQSISGSRKKYSSVNLKKIDQNCENGDTIIIAGKVLGVGTLNKKIRIAAMSFSEQAIEKLKKSKSEIFTLSEEIIKNPKGEGIKIVR